MSEFDWIDDLSTDAVDTLDWLDDDQPLESTAQLQSALIFERRVARRQTLAAAKHQNLARLIPALPAPDTDLYILGAAEGAEKARGQINPDLFDFGSYIPHLVNLLGNQGCRCYCSTWVMNRGHVEMLLAMLDDGRLSELHILTDPFFKRRHTAAIANSLIAGLQQRPPSRILFFQNHAKVLAISNPDQTRFVSVNGSSNLTAVARVENYVMTTSPEVYQFYTQQFFERMFNDAKRNARNS